MTNVIKIKGRWSDFEQPHKIVKKYAVKKNILKIIVYIYTIFKKNSCLSIEGARCVWERTCSLPSKPAQRRIPA